jgi:hypothetical protein
MRTLQTMLQGQGTSQLWFDAWVYARQEEALWRALLLRVIEALREHTVPVEDRRLQGPALAEAQAAFNALWISPDDAAKAAAELEEARISLYRSVTASEKGRLHVNWAGGLPLVADAALAAVTAGLSKEIAKAIGGKDGPEGPMAALAKWIKSGDTKELVKLIEREATERYVEQVGSLEQFQNVFRRLLARFQIGAGCADQRRLLIFVDDLDRCLPENAVAALEAIKLFLDIPGCVFVLGMDRTVVEQGIKVRYASLESAGFNPGAYLDKIIQVPFNLPPLGDEQIDAFLVGMAARPELADIGPLVRLAAPGNPRALKRVLNALLLNLYLDAAGGGGGGGGPQINPMHRRQYLAKLVLLQVCFEPVWRGIADEGTPLKDLENAVRQPGRNQREHLDNLVKLGGPRMDALFRADPFFDPLSDAEVGELLTLSRITASSTPTPANA